MGRVLAPVLVGRAAELARLVSVVATPPAVAVVEGEAGIGKTRLVEELRAHPDAAGRRFLTGAARPIQEPFPLGPVLEALRTVAAELAPGRLSPVTGALRPLLPELAGVLPATPDRLDNRVAERHRVFRGLRELLAALGPVAVVLEDLHWADQQTVELLYHLVYAPPPELSLVLTLRGEEVEPQVRGLAARLPAGTGGEHLVLPPLDPAQTGELAAALLQTDRVPDEFASALCERTGGLPYAVEEVLALLRERGQVDRRDPRWRSWPCRPRFGTRRWPEPACCRPTPGSCWRRRRCCRTRRRSG